MGLKGSQAFYCVIKERSQASSNGLDRNAQEPFHWPRRGKGQRAKQSKFNWALNGSGWKTGSINGGSERIEEQSCM